MKTFYSVIGCEEALSQKELKDKYFELIRNVHPDKNPHTDLDSFTVAHKAWSVLRYSCFHKNLQKGMTF